MTDQPELTLAEVERIEAGLSELVAAWPASKHFREELRYVRALVASQTALRQARIRMVESHLYVKDIEAALLPSGKGESDEHDR